LALEVNRMDGLQGADSEGGGAGTAEATVSSRTLHQREYQRAYRARRRAETSRSASSQSSSSQQREAQAVANRGDEQANVVPKEEGRGQLICDELPYVEARQFEEGPFVVIWWRGARYAFEMDLVEAKYIHMLMGYAIDAIEQKSKGEV
jgi:hypothetical protein